MTDPALFPHTFKVVHVLTQLAIYKRVGDVPTIVRDLEGRDAQPLPEPIEHVTIMPFI